jgi:hypothetical protein
MTFTKVGLFSWAGAALILLFQSLSGLMGTDWSWSVITVGSVTNKVLDPYIEKISFESISNFINYVVNTMELSLLLVVIGFICIILGAFKKV